MTHSFPTRRSSELRAAARTWAAGTDHLILCASRGGSYNGAVSKGGKGLQARSEGPFMSLTRISVRSEEHTSELQSLMRISYAVFCLKKTKHPTHQQTTYLSILHNTHKEHQQ